MTRTELRWVLLPFEVALAFILVGKAAALIAEKLHISSEPVSGFFAAFAVVAVTYLGAPRSKLFAAVISFVLGGAVAYGVLKDSFDPRTYEPTLMPFWVTLAGGALAITIASVHAFLKRGSPSNTSPGRVQGT